MERCIRSEVNIRAVDFDTGVSDFLLLLDFEWFAFE